MKLRFYPLYLTIFASLTIPVGQLISIQIKEVTYLPVLAALILAAFLPSSYRFSTKKVWMLFGLLCYLVSSLLLGLGIGSGGTIIVLVLAMVFKLFFLTDSQTFEGKLDMLIRSVIFFYKFNIVYLYSELLLVLAGYQKNLQHLLSVSEVLPGYKGYNHAHFLQYIGFDVTGLGGLYLGSQAAGMIAVMSAVIFFQLGIYVKQRLLWLALAFGAVIFCSNMTALLMLAFAVFLLVFIFHSKVRSFKNMLLFCIFLPFLGPVIFYKIDNLSEFETYFSAFIPSVDIFVNNLMSINVPDLLFGYGSVGHHKHSLEGLELGTDFGLMALINQAGLILLFFGLSALLHANSLVMTSHRQVRYASSIEEKASATKLYNLLVTNIIIVNILFVSLVHYTTAVEIGIRELWAMHAGLAMAIVAYCTNNSFNKSNV